MIIDPSIGNSLWFYVAPLLFLVVAAIGVKIFQAFSRRTLSKKYSEPVLVEFMTTVASGFLWFGIILVTLSMYGFNDIAASLGTATGFIALGVSFALKDMIADVVSGVRLLKDEDFNPGDNVEAAGFKGEVVEIDLRKTRLTLETGERAVVSNKDVEKSWKKL